jgi:hypothetical protein
MVNFLTNVSIACSFSTSTVLPAIAEAEKASAIVVKAVVNAFMRLFP